MSEAVKTPRVPKAQRWGNSVAVRIPASLLASTGISEGSPLEISAQGNGIFIRPAPAKVTYSIQSLNPFSEELLVRDLSPESAHADEAFNPTAGELGEK